MCAQRSNQHLNPTTRARTSDRVRRRGLEPVEIARGLGIDLSPSDLVSIDSEALTLVAGGLQSRTHAGGSSVPAKWDDARFWNVEGTREERSQYFAVGNSVNFRFWSLEEGRVVPAMGWLQGEQYRGAMYMWRCLRLGLDAGSSILDPGFLASLRDEQFDRIFVDDRGNNPLSVARDERIANLRDLGTRLLEDWNGRFYSLVTSTRHSITRFAQLSRGFRAFDDPLCKLTMVTAILHSGSGIYRFDDGPLPGVDYQLLKQLVRQGILCAAPQLSMKLREGRLLDSSEAYELRRVALAALLEIAALAGLSGEVLDNTYWMNRTNCTDARPVCQDPSTAAQCPFFGECARRVEFGLPLELTRYY
jgi:hypothetical protein